MIVLVRKTNIAAFTLVELAIALVVIGLLVAGVLQGRDLIYQSKVKNVISSLRDFEAGVSTFRLKYNEIPGDTRRASMFGVNCPKGITCDATADNVAGTDCDADADGADGDGNGNWSLEGQACTSYIEYYNGEIANFWVHLSNPFFIKGSFSQTDDCEDDTCGFTTGINFPEMELGNAVMPVSSAKQLYWVLGVGPNGWDTAGLGETEGSNIIGDELTPTDAYEVDLKMDDGTPNGGNVRAISAYDSTTSAFTEDAAAADDCSAATGVYDITNSNKVCTLKIKASAG